VTKESRSDVEHERRWLTMTSDGEMVWINMDHVRQVLFRGVAAEASALLWCRGDLWEIADPAGLALLRRYLRERALG
jgi:hypothetical protein